MFFKGNVSEEIFELADKIGQESSIIVTGKVKEDARQVGGVEIDATGLIVIQDAKDYPITPKEHGIGISCLIGVIYGCVLSVRLR